MRHNREKTKKEVPASLRNCTEALQDIATHKNKEAISDKVYKGANNEVREALSEIFYHKCAYCEDTEHKPEVEHYRPKKSVTEDNAHDGYYWLCYEWTNLLPACHDCNTNGGKGNKFPLQDGGTRQFAPVFNADGSLNTTACQAHNNLLLGEHPYLLHPEIDEPEHYFLFDNEGTIKGIDRKGRGQKTIEICNLNRKNLLYQRQRIVDEFFNNLDYLFGLYCKNYLDNKGLEMALQIIIEEQAIKSTPNQPFSLLALQCLSHFEDMMLPLFHGAMHHVLEKAIEWFRNSLK